MVGQRHFTYSVKFATFANLNFTRVRQFCIIYIMIHNRYYYRTKDFSPSKVKTFFSEINALKARVSMFFIHIQHQHISFSKTFGGDWSFSFLGLTLIIKRDVAGRTKRAVR